MHANEIGPGINKFLDIATGVIDHQVDVEEESVLLATPANDRWSEGDVGDKVSVHDVPVDPFDPCLFKGCELFAQPTEIR